MNLLGGLMAVEQKVAALFARISRAWRNLKSFSIKFWWIAPILVVTWVFREFIQELPQPDFKNLTETGQFGDSFGALTSIFTGLGFCGLIVTLALQQKQIAIQERELAEQRRKDENLRYEETLFKLLSLYKETLEEVSSRSTPLTGRALLRGAVDRALAAVKKERINVIPHDIQSRLHDGTLMEADLQYLDFLYFRNFKVLSVEIDRQGRLTNTLKILLKHLVERAPDGFAIDPYRDLVLAQLTYVEVSYFFLVALTFKAEDELRDLLSRAGFLDKAAHVKRLRIHDLMYQDFWGVKLRDHKQPVFLPISDARIARGLEAYRRRDREGSGDQRTYATPRAQSASRRQR